MLSRTSCFFASFLLSLLDDMTLQILTLQTILCSVKVKEICQFLICFCSKFSPMFAIKFYRNQGKILYIKCTQGNVLYSIQYGCKCVIDRYINYLFLLKEPEVLLYVLHCIYYLSFSNWSTWSSALKSNIRDKLL